MVSATKPVTELVTKPVTEPVNQPATEPVTEPVTRPAAKPVTKPAANRAPFMLLTAFFRSFGVPYAMTLQATAAPACVWTQRRRAGPASVSTESLIADGGATLRYSHSTLRSPLSRLSALPEVGGVTSSAIVLSRGAGCTAKVVIQEKTAQGPAGGWRCHNTVVFARGAGCTAKVVVQEKTAQSPAGGWRKRGGQRWWQHR